MLKYLPENVDACDRPATFQIIESNNKIFCLDTRPTQFRYGCSRRRIGFGNSVRTPPVLFNSNSSLQNKQRKSWSSNIYNSRVRVQYVILVSKSSRNISFTTSQYQLSQYCKVFWRIQKGWPFHVNKKPFSTSSRYR